MKAKDIAFAITWIALVVSNLLWHAAYHKLDLDDMQANAMLDWANDYIHDASRGCK